MRSRLLVVVSLTLALLVGGIGSTGQAAEAKKQKLKLILSEFTIRPKQTTITAGKVKVIAENRGGDEHEVVIFEGDDPAALPLDEDGAVDEEAIEDREVGEIEDVAPGKSKSKTFKLESGYYILLCNIVEEEDDGDVENHFAEGMYTTIYVT